ncbi:MAG: dioxygenase [Hahellaceae bacterium]|nr:dioxygenase [Hahellaceae bacterium]MCP5169345.1 dioxygenase [Hahellaceae bacterium]
MTQAHSAASHTVLFLSHGGGPMPLLGDAGHADMVAALKRISTLIAKPSAILVVSAHWEASRPTLTSSPNPPLIYDYYGFPASSYEIRYPVLGAPALARKLYEGLSEQGMAAELDSQRGFDHGVFVPLKLMYPDADIPCVQLSLLDSLDPQAHIRLGEVIASVEQEGLLVIGSGFSFHNMKAFFAANTAESQARNESFEAWLSDTCANPSISESDRTHRLLHWDEAPAARYCHPREEHLLPLLVCYGVAKRACHQVFKQTILNKQASAYLWEGEKNVGDLDPKA